MTSLVRANISVKPSLVHGFGVFADADIAAGDIIEECHTIFLNEHDPILINYTFAVKDHLQEDKKCMVLGYGSIYNHGYPANAGYKFDEKMKVMRFTALKPIQCGEEIFTNYGDTWFCSRNTLPVQVSKWFMLKLYMHKYRRTLRALLFSTALLLSIKLLTSL